MQAEQRSCAGCGYALPTGARVCIKCSTAALGMAGVGRVELRQGERDLRRASLLINGLAVTLAPCVDAPFL